VAAVDIPPDLVITVTDARRAGYCARGLKSWFEGHGLDFAAFLKSGIKAADLPEDAFAENVIARKLGQ
jgi:hypothetical protein